MVIDGIPSLLSAGEWVEPEEFFIGSKAIPIAKCLLRFNAWRGRVPADCYGKTVLDFEGEAMFAELAILRLLQRDGFDGVWVDAFRRRFRQSMLNFLVPLRPSQMTALRSLERIPGYVKGVYEKVRDANHGKAAGCWDVLVRRRDIVLFLESKQHTPKCRDRISSNEKRWLETAMKVGIKPSSFVVWEWKFASSP